jgi:DNA-binding MarR family transcriptional regulator
MGRMSEPIQDMDCYEPGGLAAAGVSERFALLVYKAGIEVLARGEAALEPLGISGREYTALAILSSDAPESQQDLARLMGKGAVAVVAIVDGLEEKGLVARRRSDRDRRRSVVGLTDAGREMLVRADEAAESVTQTLFAALGEDEREALHTSLRRALDADAATIAAGGYVVP